MTAEERNIETAKMCGWKKYKLERNFFFGKKRMTYYLFDEPPNFWSTRFYSSYFSYDSDWNWLMVAVKFIESLKNEQGYKWRIDIYVESCSIYNVSNLSTTPLICINKLNKKEAVFQAVSDFAKLYNDKKL